MGHIEVAIEIERDLDRIATAIMEDIMKEGAIETILEENHLEEGPTLKELKEVMHRQEAIDSKVTQEASLFLKEELKRKLLEVKVVAFSLEDDNQLARSNKASDSPKHQGMVLSIKQQLIIRVVYRKVNRFEIEL